MKISGKVSTIDLNLTQYYFGGFEKIHGRGKWNMKSEIISRSIFHLVLR